MQSKCSHRSLHFLLVAGLVLGAAAAQAASGITISRDQETLVLVGMSTGEVERAIGRPDEIAGRPFGLGLTWVYEVAGVQFPMVLFDVYFGTDGKVERFGERVDDEID